MDLKNAAVLVTGGSCGIGLETARLLRSRGARVAICARHKDILESAAKEIGAVPIVADVSREEDVQRLIGAVVKVFPDRAGGHEADGRGSPREDCKGGQKHKGNGWQKTTRSQNLDRTVEERETLFHCKAFLSHRRL